MKILNRKKAETIKALKIELKTLVSSTKLSIVNLKFGISQVIEALEGVDSDYPYSEAEYDKILKEVQRLVTGLVSV